MSGSSFIDEIKDKCNIVDVIGRVVPLKKAGSNYKGICPFHKEKTPSFVVSEQKQIFTCFGCGATGNVIGFVQKYYNLEFMEACEKLADEYGIEIRKGYNRGSENAEKLYEVNRLAARYFFSNITKKGNQGLSYMLQRGIEIPIIKKFGIGYAEDSWDGLYKHMKSHNVDDDTLMKLGLISKGKGTYYDKFRNRVMFPIINARGKIIGFGGRIIGEGMPKYLNSPESPIFQKKNNLYGINITRGEMSSKDQAILVEGYMDVVSLYQAGVKNVSASLGTALTENQAKLLTRYTKNVVLSYDADSAGRKAALRGIEILHNQGLKPKVLHVTEGKDPDEFVKKKGTTAFQKLVDEALIYADYKFEDLLSRYDLESTEGRIDFVKEAAEILKTLSPAEQDLYIGKVAEMSGISEGAIRREISGTKNTQRHEWAKSEEQTKEEIDILPVEKTLIKVLLSNSSYFEIVKDTKGAFRSVTGRRIFDGISTIIKENGDIDNGLIRDVLDEHENAVIDDIVENVPLGGKEKEVLEDCINRVRMEELSRRYSEISSILDLTEDSEKVRELMTEQMDIQKELRRRKQKI